MVAELTRSGEGVGYMRLGDTVDANYSAVTLRNRHTITLHNSVIREGNMETTNIPASGIPTETVTVNPDSTVTVTRKPRKPSTGQRHAPKRVASKAEGKRKARVRLSQGDEQTAAQNKTAEEGRQYRGLCANIKRMEESTVNSDAARSVALYFGTGTVKGLKTPVFTARYTSQREAVIGVWSKATGKRFADVTPDEKKAVNALVAKMVRLRDEGYRLLSVAPPVKNGGRPAAPVVDRALASVKKFVQDMTTADKAAFLKLVRKVVNGEEITRKVA